MQSLIYRETPQSRKFGVELEVNKSVTKKKLGDIIAAQGILCDRSEEVRVTSGVAGWEESRKNDYWHVKYDSTCGWEVASFIAHGDADIDYIASTADCLSLWGAKTDEN